MTCSPAWCEGKLASGEGTCVRFRVTLQSLSEATLHSVVSCFGGEQRIPALSSSVCEGLGAGHDCDLLYSQNRPRRASTVLSNRQG
jgi:hypothetical protein